MSELFTEQQNKIFNTLYKLDVNDNVEKKKTGSTYLSYLSWAWAWAEVKKKFPQAQYSIQKFENNLPYVFDPNTGYMVFTTVTIDDMTYEMWLPVMDGANKAMKHEPYTYKVIKWENGERNGFTDKEVEAASMFDINKTIMRCLVKNLAMFGLGLYIYAGEDLPESPKAPLINGKQLAELREHARAISEIAGREPGVYLAKLAETAKLNSIDELFAEHFESAKNQLIKWKEHYAKAAETKKEEKQESINWGNKE